MKQFSLVLVCMLLANQFIYAQCQPNAPRGQAGLSPETDSLPCVNRGEYYSEVFFLENFDTAYIGPLVITVDTLRVDSITNGPCGLKWLANEGDNAWGVGESGCVRIYGTTNDTVGQYKLNIYITAYIPILGVINGEVSEVVANLETLLGQNLYIDFNYWVRVKETGDPCPGVIRNDSTANDIASLNCNVSNDFNVEIAAPSLVCLGDTVILSPTVTGSSVPKFRWFPNTELDDSISASPKLVPTRSDWYTVELTDSLTGEITYDRVFIHVSQSLPVSTFTTAYNELIVGFTATSNDVTSYVWDFGDGDSSITKGAIHTYDSAGTYIVNLTVTNICGSNTKTDTVTVVELSTADLALLNLVKVWPNPATNTVQIDMPEALKTMQPTITIFNLYGSEVNKIQVNPSTDLTIPVSDYAAGIYFITIQTPYNTSTQKLLIQ